jgi:hypothetical protein
MKTSVLFVRCTPDLLARLDKAVAAARKANQGQSVSRSDMARQMLYAALTTEKERWWAT